MPPTVAASDVFAAVAEPRRREILVHLAPREQTVTDIVGRMGVAQPSVSKHLKVLRDAGLVSTRREGRQVFYRTNVEALRPLQEWAAIFERFWGHQLSRVKERAERAASGKGGKP